MGQTLRKELWAQLMPEGEPPIEKGERQRNRSLMDAVVPEHKKMANPVQDDETEVELEGEYQFEIIVRVGELS